MTNPNFESDEKEFQLEIGPLLSGLRANAGPCPHPDEIAAASAGVLFESADRVHEHLLICPICRQLSRDLAAYEYPAISEDEDRRIRSRLPQGPRIPSRNVSWWAWFWRPFPLAAAAAVVAIVVVIGVFNVRRPQVNIEQSAKSLEAVPAPSTPRSVFVLEKAAIKVSAAAVLIYRSGGGDSGKAFLDDLASALAPYRADDYSEAARRLEEVSRKYPQSAEPYFYLGVSRLFLNQSEMAVESLNTARPLAGDTLRDDVSWYLALALDRAGRTAAARREAESLCSRSGEYQQMACAAVRELGR